MAKTRKVKAKKVLKVDSKDKIPKFEVQLKTGNINFVLVYAEWCGACHRFMDNIWNPMCKGKARHNRMAVRDDMIKNTSLANANFDYLPSVLIVDEKGQLQSFKTPEGNDTNAMPTPKSLNDMKKIVNVPVINITNSLNGLNGKPVQKVQSVNTRKNTPFVRMESSPTRPLFDGADEESSVTANMGNMGNMPNIPNMGNMPNIPNIPKKNNSPNASLNKKENRLTTEEFEPMGTPAGTVYRPTPMVSPQKGGKRSRNMRRMGFPKEFMRKFGLAFTRRIKKN